MCARFYVWGLAGFRTNFGSCVRNRGVTFSVSTPPLPRCLAPERSIQVAPRKPSKGDFLVRAEGKPMAERNKLHKEQNHASAAIAKDKHNAKTQTK